MKALSSMTIVSMANGSKVGDEVGARLGAVEGDGEIDGG